MSKLSLSCNNNLCTLKILFNDIIINLLESSNKYIIKLLGPNPNIIPQKYIKNETIKIGILYSHYYSFDIATNNIIRSILLAIKEINNTGILINHKTYFIDPIIISDIDNNGNIIDQLHYININTIIICSYGDYRKLIIPKCINNNILAWYPFSYEGQECEKNIIYTGPVPNQQVEFSIKYFIDKSEINYFLIGTESIYSRTINEIASKYIKNNNANVVGELYIDINQSNLDYEINNIIQNLPDGGVIISTIINNIDLILYQRIKEMRLNYPKYKILSYDINEPDTHLIDTKYTDNIYTCSNYFQSIDSIENIKYINNYYKLYNINNYISDYMTNAYNSIYLWKLGLEKANSLDIIKIINILPGIVLNSPCGTIRIEKNHHVSYIMRIAQVNIDGHFDIIMNSKSPIPPYIWNNYISKIGNCNF